MLGTASFCPLAPSVPRPAIQSAMLAFNSATSFDAMCFKANVAEPLLNAINTSAKKAICCHSRTVDGRRLPRCKRECSSSEPPISERSDVNSNGGRSMTPMRATRKLEPQTR